MSPKTASFTEPWNAFTPVERRNSALYIAAIMLYKFGLEAFNGSIVALATNRYDELARTTSTPAKTFERVGLLTGLNQAFQCVGSILIAPLVKRYSTKTVLSAAILVFAVFSALLLIIDAATGGTFVPEERQQGDFSHYGDYNTDGIIPVFCVCGVVYGMVELIRRIIPRDLVGGDVRKLRRLDALVHIYYEIAGTAGAFVTALVLIPRFGNNFSFIITPICFTMASVTWFFIEETGFDREPLLLHEEQPSYARSVLNGICLFFESVYTGAKLLFTRRKFVWLLPGYAFALYGHRYLENGLAPAIARRYLGNSAWSQIMVGGSNLGELLGALFVFIFTNFITTPMPWLRLDSLMLLILWYVPYWYPPSGDVKQAWIVAGTFLPISFGWAAGDVSLAAYIQASLARLESESKNVSALGSVMAFLYCTYIVIYAITSPLLGRYIDAVSNRSDENIHEALKNVGGIQFSLLCALIMAATFVPKGAFAVNPKILSEEDLDCDFDDRSSSMGGSIKDYELNIRRSSTQSHVSHEE